MTLTSVAADCSDPGQIEQKGVATDVDGLRTHCPGLVFATIEVAGDFPMLTRPEMFNPLLRDERDRLAERMAEGAQE